MDTLEEVFTKAFKLGNDTDICDAIHTKTKEWDHCTSETVSCTSCVLFKRSIVHNKTLITITKLGI